MKKVLIQLISKQTMQNYIAIKYYQPDIVVSLVTEDYEKVTQKYDVIFEHIAFQRKKYDAFDITNNIETLNKVIEQYKDCEVIINFTGGSKLMSTASFFIQSDLSILYAYVDTQTKSIHEIELGEDKKIKEHNKSLKDFAIPFRDFFTLVGEEIESKPITEITEEIKARKEDAKELAEHEYSQLYNHTTPNERGKLFEEYVFYRLKLHAKPKKRFDEVVADIVIPLSHKAKLSKQAGQASKSDVDIFVTKNLQAAMIECKAGQFGQDDIIKINNKRRQILGPYGIAILVSKNPPKDVGLIEKAKDNNVKLLNIKAHGDRLPAHVEAIILGKELDTK